MRVAHVYGSCKVNKPFINSQVRICYKIATLPLPFIAGFVAVLFSMMKILNTCVFTHADILIFSYEMSGHYFTHTDILIFSYEMSGHYWEHCHVRETIPIQL